MQTYLMIDILCSAIKFFLTSTISISQALSKTKYLNKIYIKLNYLEVKLL